MKIPQIQIQTVDAKLEMKNAIPRGILEIQQEQAAVILEITYPQIQIDSTASRAAVGFKNNEQLNEEIKQKAMQSFMQFIQKKNQEGGILANIHNKQDGFVLIANQSNIPKDLDIQIMSIPKPNISLIRGEMKISTKNLPEEAVSIQYTPSKFNTNYIPGDISIDVRV